MRILQLRLTNLNSLLGEWSIDLTHPAYQNSGIFAITGPTGAGKSTLLDALCLALYGRTPRLAKIGKGGNELMSRHTGECAAEVTFTTQAGHFRCHWGQRRAHRRAKGELQAPRHEIADVSDGSILESRLRKVSERVEQVTGMDFRRFVRSMLLAQGAFDTFLRAPPDDRAPILEQITGTAIYSEISIAAHQHRSTADKRLEQLEQEVAGLALLSPQQQQQLASEQQQLVQQQSALAQQLAQAEQHLAWQREIQQLEQGRVELEQQRQQQQSATQLFAADRERLQRATQALELHGDHRQLTTLRQQECAERQQLDALTAALPADAQQVALATAALEQAVADYQAALELLREQRPLLDRVRQLDQELRHRQQEMEAQQQQDAALQQQQQRLQQQQQDLRTTLEQLQQQQSALLQRLAVQPEGSTLVGELPLLEQFWEQWQALEQQCQQQRRASDQAEAAVTAAAAAWQQAQQQSAQQQQRLARSEQRQQALQQQLAQQVQQAEQREEALQREEELLEQQLLLLTTIANLHADRTRLQSGQPCPLCGSVEHPYANGEIPQPDPIRQQRDQVRQAVRQVRRELAGYRAAADEIVKEQQQQRAADQQQQRVTQEAAHQHALAHHQQQHLAHHLAELGSQQQRLEEQLQQRLARYPPAPSTTAQIPQRLGQLRDALERWQYDQQQRITLGEQIATRSSQLAPLQQRWDEQRQQQQALQQRLATLREEWRQQQQQRQQWLGDDSPDVLEQQLQRAFEQAESAREVARQRQQMASEQQQQRLTRSAERQQRIAAIAQQLPTLEEHFYQRLRHFAFASETDFQQALLDESQRQRLQAEAQRLSRLGDLLESRLRDLTHRLERRRQEAFGAAPLEQLEPQCEQLRGEQQQLLQRLGALRQQLDHHQQQQQRQQQQLQAIAAQQQECQRWRRLSSLIGSADGKRYRNFAQGLTFEQMIHYANRELRRMNDRYLLLHDPQHPLELSVLDSYQGGEVRSTKNLSGGEGFILSLALALGLSNMAGSHIRIDALFLDEGFGTLDEEALDSALDALATLPQEGKLIGIISHVPALKERITTRIEVHPRSGGRAILAGPGVERVSR